MLEPITIALPTEALSELRKRARAYWMAPEEFTRFLLLQWLRGGKLPPDSTD